MIQFDSISSIKALKTLCEIVGWKFTNLQIQKILYIINLYFVGVYNKPLIKENFEAWDYGPVLPKLYKEINFFGADIVEDVFWNVKPLDKDTECYKIIEDIGTHLSTFTSSHLVKLTHRQGTAWDKHYKPGRRHITIPRESMLEEYNQFYKNPNE